MLLYISDHKTVEELQDRFNDCFPNLRIEFYSEADDAKEKDFKKSNLVKSYERIGDIRIKSYTGVLDIKSWDKTSQIKKEFKEVFGLNIQLFRLYKDQWIPATYSDELTLKQQCDLARGYAVI